MNCLQLISGIDIPIVEIQTAVHQPTIEEISYMGEKEYFSALSLLCFNKNMIIALNPQGTSQLSAMNNFEIFMTLMAETQDPKRRQDVLDVLQMLFPGYTAQLLPRGLYFNNATTKHNFTLDENNFEAVQSVLSTISGMQKNPSNANSMGEYHPVGKRAAEIAAKLQRGKARVQKQQGNNNEDVLARYVSVLTVGLQSMPLSACLKLTVCQLYDLVERYSLYLSWDLDIRTRLAGGKPDNKPDDWMKNIH